MADEIQRQINRFNSLIQAWNASYEEYAKSVGMSYTSLSILCGISEIENCTQKRLCESCFLPKQTVNAVISSFYKKGWIRLEEMPEDRRNKRILFTPTGRAYAEPILQEANGFEHRAMSALSAQERKMLLDALEKYVSQCEKTMRES